VAAVREIQNGFHIAPLSKWTGIATATETKDEKKSVPTPHRAVDKMSAQTYFQYAADLLRINPPHASDVEFVERMKRVGFVPGQPFDLTQAPAEIRAAFEEAPFTGQKRMRENEWNATKHTNGWRINTNGIGVYGNDYLKRAIIAKTALGANAPADAVYPMTNWDSTGQPLSGGHYRYVLHFEKEELPPVNAFWSVTVYKDDGFPATNGIDRYAIGDRDPLTYNPDGSLDIYIQNESPGKDLESNWLPAPQKPFNLTMRLYWPKEAVLNGTWSPPLVRRVN
jgi:hypothetical protein